MIRHWKRVGDFTVTKKWSVPLEIVGKHVGELNQDVYWDYVMNPETRLIEHLVYNEEQHEEMEHYFEVFMGEDTQGRKDFTEKHISNVSLEEILY